MVESTQQAYRSYLVRLWRDEQSGDFTWHGSLVSVQTGERRHFADADQLIAYIRQRMDLNTDCEDKV